MRFSCAGKVFITGEYSCIEGGPALLGTVGPDFLLDLAQEPGEHALPFHEESPAGRYLSAHRKKLSGVRLNWRDPYDVPIGVGSSSAQFILSVAALAELEAKPLPPPGQMLELYWNTVGTTQGLRPSGVDILAQQLGGPVVVRNNPCEHHKLPAWKGTSHFVLAFTGKKAKTHEHLLKLHEKGFPRDFRDVLAHLDRITLAAIEAWQMGNEKLLGSALNAYQAALAQGELAPREFTAELEHIQKWPGVLGCKGSGAQGGDCVLLLIDESSLQTTLPRIRELGWNPELARWVPDGIRRSEMLY